MSEKDKRVAGDTASDKRQDMPDEIWALGYQLDDERYRNEWYGCSWVAPSINDPIPVYYTDYIKKSQSIPIDKIEALLPELKKESSHWKRNAFIHSDIGYERNAKQLDWIIDKLQDLISEARDE